MKTGIANGIYTGVNDGIEQGAYTGVDTGFANGVYNENILQNAIVRNGLVLHLDAAQNLSYPRSGTIWRDLTANNNNGTLTNGPTFNSLNKGSIVFDGVNDYVLTANNIGISGAQARSIDVWFYLNNSTTRNVLCSWGAFFASRLCNLELIPIAGAIYPYFVGFNNDAYAAQAIPINTWVNIILTYGGGNLNAETGMKIYVNGFSKSLIFPNSVLPINTANTRVSIGYEFAGLRNPMNGRISNVKIYNRVLTAAEILQNYIATKSRFNL